ncbi:MAG TPA: cytochrome c [Stellaceae bacterium]|jgi:mono/diheme cytochrome c family protein
MRKFIAPALAAFVAGAVPLPGLPDLPRHIVRPALADQAQSGFDGEKLFATSCGWCHSSGGRVAGKGPKLAGTDKSDEFIVNRIKHGKPPVMPAFAKAFNDEQIKAIVAYIHSLKDEQG